MPDLNTTAIILLGIGCGGIGFSIAWFILSEVRQQTTMSQPAEVQVRQSPRPLRKQRTPKATVVPDPSPLARLMTATAKDHEARAMVRVKS